MAAAQRDRLDARRMSAATSGRHGVHRSPSLVAALGGEGGGVLADWLVAAAQQAGLPVQATSVPGVAQRTGATTYYIELFHQPAPPGRQPVLALMPVPGRVDVVLASELLEGVRVVERGFVDDQRTMLVAARHRVYPPPKRWPWATAASTQRLLAAARSGAAAMPGARPASTARPRHGDLGGDVRRADRLRPPALAARGGRGRDPPQRCGGGGQPGRLWSGLGGGATGAGATDRD